MPEVYKKTINVSNKRPISWLKKSAAKFGFELEKSVTYSQSVNLEFISKSDSQPNMEKLSMLFEQFLDCEREKQKLQDKLDKSSFPVMWMLLLFLTIIIPVIIAIFHFSNISNMKKEIELLEKKQDDICEEAMEILG
ncbi:hypothetical protein [Mycoplasma sp. HS2188]|uniref:hypothetical protein n=1 Tax=Mycoplasma sp. HS2188 TaxID=2976765 RepID=UPI0021A9C620|nr:hypothetical protein [Mycoplasma sp. HS2188]MCT4469600.1 hypothetical protein [Mycoplasma sp. HS2188]